MECFFNRDPKHAGYLFYLVSPNKTSYRTVPEVPNFANDVIPFFVVLIVLETFAVSIKKRSTLPLNDSLASLIIGMIYLLARIFSHSVEIYLYVWTYENYRLVTLSWNSPFTWYLGFIGVDFVYYWLHRACHEVNIFWSAHQVHHSSEHFLLSSSLRLSIFQDVICSVFYIPLALVISPATWIVHKQFNLIFQFWLHTEFIKSIGPLEYVLNTPSHHRVHHGRNRYCIDKNYGSVFIIWDRIFGTFEPESEKVVYGLTHPVNSFNPIYVQFFLYYGMFKRFSATKGFKNKMSVLFKGPGWEPGKPWHGNIEDIPDVHAPVPYYEPNVSTWSTIYVFYHMLLIFIGFYELLFRHMILSQVFVISVMAYIILSLTAVGAILSNSTYASWTELSRCLLYYPLKFYILPTHVTLYPTFYTFYLQVLQVSFGISALIWTSHCIKNFPLHVYFKNKTL